MHNFSHSLKCYEYLKLTNEGRQFLGNLSFLSTEIFAERYQ